MNAHICAAVNENGKNILIDATLPYRKWHGFDCPHQDYELFSPDEFEYKMKIVKPRKNTSAHSFQAAIAFAYRSREFRNVLI